MANRTPQAQLSELLLSLFSADELRRFVRYLPDGDTLMGSLPGANASASQTAQETVYTLERHGLINHDLFDRLAAERPRRAHEINELRQHFNLRTAPSPSHPAPVTEAAPAEAPRVIVLCDATAIDAVTTLRKHLGSWASKGQITLDTIFIDEWSSDLPGVVGSVCLLLLTAGLLAGAQIQDQLRDLMALHRVGTLRLVPVLVTPTRWRTTVLGSLSPLPANGIPISAWNEHDGAWAEVFQGIARTLPGATSSSGLIAGAVTARPTTRSLPNLVQAPSSKTIAPPATTSATPVPAAPQKINHIFRTNGPPDVNFVAPAQLPELRIRMGFMGDGLVVEGPSGIGKTTATRHALLELLGGTDLDTLVSAGKVRWLSSKSDDDLAALRTLLAAGHARLRGHLVIDDFHRLERGIQAQVADLIKLLADGGHDLAKVVVIGINPVGTSLVQDFPDLAGRFTVVSMSKQPDEKIEELIVKGEHAANITFDRRPQFVAAARGSFFTAQLLCLEAAIRDGIDETQPTPRVVVTGPDGVILDKVHSRLKFKYQEPLLAFASYDELPPPRGACLVLLWLLTQEPDSTVSLVTARTRYPALAAAFDWLLGSKLSALFASQPRLRELFFYNRDAGVLSAEDPQLDFYLRNLNWPALARDSGHAALDWDPQQGFRPRAAAPGPNVALAVPPASRLKLPRSRVLHLSDLHFGTQAQALLWYGQLLADLRSELACDQLDAVVLSGDITNRAASDEFNAAAQFLRDLKEDFKLAPHQFILVPGNHDLSWAVAKRAYRVMRRADHDGVLNPGEYIDNGAYIEVPVEAELRGRFQPFADFYYSVRNEAYPLDYEYQATIHHFPDKQLLILGLNSAWWLDHAFTTRADIHGVALGRALRRIQQEPGYVDTVKLAVFHHPVDSPDPDRLRDTGFVERLAQAGFRLALHGHIHRPQTGLYRYDMAAAGRRLDFLGAGTFGAPTREWVPGFPLQYQLLEFNGDDLRVHTRRREVLDGAWRPDARWTQGPGQNPLPYYDIEL